MADHVPVGDLAEVAEDLLTGPRRAEIEQHLADCAECRSRAAEVSQVQAVLTAQPRPAMPADVSTRLARVLADEAAGRISVTPLAGRSGLGTFGSDLGSRKRRWVMPALAAAASAALVGFGGYAVSAAAGLNEPPVVAGVAATALAAQAGAFEASAGRHLFSRAWQCARDVTDGRITGLASSRLDGQPALLVYTRAGAGTQVVVVTGCAQDSPTAGPSAVLPR